MNKTAIILSFPFSLILVLVGYYLGVRIPSNGLRKNSRVRSITWDNFDTTVIILNPGTGSLEVKRVTNALLTPQEIRELFGWPQELVLPAVTDKRTKWKEETP